MIIIKNNNFLHFPRKRIIWKSTIGTKTRESLEIHVVLAINTNPLSQNISENCAQALNKDVIISCLRDCWKIHQNKSSLQWEDYTITSFSAIVDWLFMNLFKCFLTTQHFLSFILKTTKKHNLKFSPKSERKNAAGSMIRNRNNVKHKLNAAMPKLVWLAILFINCASGYTWVKMHNTKSLDIKIFCSSGFLFLKTINKIIKEV